MASLKKKLDRNARELDMKNWVQKQGEPKAQSTEPQKDRKDNAVKKRTVNFLS